MKPFPSGCRSRPGHISQNKFSAAEAIEVTLRAGGVPALARAYQIKPTSSEHLEEIVRELCAVGLQGIEVYYSRHRREQVVEYAALASKYGLLVT